MSVDQDKLAAVSLIPCWECNDALREALGDDYAEVNEDAPKYHESYTRLLQGMYKLHSCIYDSEIDQYDKIRHYARLHASKLLLDQVIDYLNDIENALWDSRYKSKNKK